MRALSLETACFIAIKAHEFDAKEDAETVDPGSNPTDDRDIDVLEDHADDAVADEIREAIEDLNIDAAAELLALVLLGRGDYAGWEQALEEARDTVADGLARQLLGEPLLGDLIEEGLDALGLSCRDVEKAHL